MPWYAVRPRDPADPRWPLPGREDIVLKADDPAHARETFAQAYPSAPYGSPTVPVPGIAGFGGDVEALLVAEAAEPLPPRE